MYEKSSNTHLLPKASREQCPVTELPGLIDHEISAANKSSHLNRKGSLDSKFLDLNKGSSILEFTGSTRLILKGARDS